MSRVITNTFTLTAVKDNEAVRDNLIHCSLMNKNRMTWWNLPDKSKVRFCSELEGRYMIMGHTGWEWIANPGYIADVQQYLAMYDRNNTDISNSALKNNTWYTLTFRSLGICRHYDENNQAVDKGTGYMYVYIYPSVVDTKTKYIVDGVEKWPVGDMATPIPLTWTAKEHTITFKTASSFSSMPRILFRSFGEGNTQYDNPSTNYYPFKEGGCLVRIAGVKLEEAREATAFKPHITEYQPPIHATAFKRTNDNLTKAPEGGSYTSPTPTGWSDGIPSDTTARLWTTKAVFLPEETTATWSKPSPVGDTVDLDVEFSPFTSIPTPPNDNNLAEDSETPTANTNKWFDPTRNPTADFSIMVWRAERKILNGVKSSWVISKIKGEDGTSFTAKGSADKHYASLSAYNAATDRVVGKYYLVDSTSGAVMYKYNESAAIACDDGDAYTTSDLHLWVKNGPIWADLGKIQGPQGAQGPQGEGGMSCTLVPSVQSIPVDSNGRPTISRFTLTAKIYKGSTLMGENDKTYSIVSHVAYKGDTTPVTSSTNASFNLNVNLDKTKVLNSVSCLLQRGQTVLHQFNLYPHADGQNTVRLDLDNEMDSVVCDNNGNLLAETTIQTTLRLYDGAELKASEQYGQLKKTDFKLNDITPVKTVSSDRMTCTFSWTFNAGQKFSDARYIKDFSIQYNGTFYLATFTLNAMRNGEDAVRYNVSASESAITFKRKADNILSPSSVVLKCNVVKTVGGTISLASYASPSNLNKVYGASLYLYYQIVGSQDSSWHALAISSGEVTVSSSSGITAVKFCLSTASSKDDVADNNIIDIETVPVVIDGLNGSNGNNGINGIDGVTLDFLSSANTIMLDDSGVEPKSITFRAMSAQGENTPSYIESSAYNIVVTEYYNGGNESTTKRCDEEPKGQLVYNIKYSTSVKKLVAELKYNTTTYRTLIIPVVKKGADGRSYNPVPRGVFATGNTYIWDEKQRDYVDYEFGGVYYRFGVKTFGMTVTAAPTKAAGDSNWEVCNRVSCLITNCIFGTNAVIGGFMVSSEKFMSTESAYTLRYMGGFSSVNKVKYRGPWSGGTTYSLYDAVLYNGTYYYSVANYNTSTPSASSSNWYTCTEPLITRIKEVVSGVVYLYEYNATSLMRPVVEDSGTYYTLKKMSVETEDPSSGGGWRELTDIELSYLNKSTIPATASIPKYTLNGKNGTVIMMQADDTCWTYDDTGKQVNGIPYGKRVEIVPASKSIDVYDEKGELALQVNGDTYETIDKAYGSGTLNPSCPTNSITGSLKSDDVGRQKTTMSIITNSDFVVKDYPLNLSVECAYSVTAEEKRFTTTPSGNYGGIYAVPYMSGNYWVYRSDCRGSIMVQKLSDDGVSWSNHNLLTSISTVGISGITARYSGTLRCVLQPGTYRLVFVFTADLFGSSNTGGSKSTCSYKVSINSLTGSYAVKTSRVFANGLAFGSATNDNFVVCREEKGIHVKASTLSNYGFELSQDKGLEVKRGGQQGIVPVLMYAGRSYKLSSNDNKTMHLYNAYSTNPTFTWTKIGICEITFPWDCHPDECIPTVTTWKGDTGVSARIVSWNVRKMVIEIDNDYSGGAGTGSDHDFGGFYIKLEFIDAINN